MSEYHEFYKYLEGRPMSELKDCVHYVVELMAVKHRQTNVDQGVPSISTDYHETFRVQRIMKDITTSNIALPHGMNGYNTSTRKFVRFLPGHGNLPVHDTIAKQHSLKPEWFIDQDLHVYLNWCPDGYFEMSRKDSLRFNQNALENHHLVLEELACPSTSWNQFKKRRIDSEGSQSLVSIVSPPSSTKSSRVDEEAKQSVLEVMQIPDIPCSSALPCLLVKGDHAFITEGRYATQECTVIGHVGADPTKYTVETVDGAVIKVDAVNLSLTSATKGTLPVYGPAPTPLAVNKQNTLASSKENAAAALIILEEQLEKQKQLYGKDSCAWKEKLTENRCAESEDDKDSWVDFFEWCFTDQNDDNEYKMCHATKVPLSKNDSMVTKNQAHRKSLSRDDIVAITKERARKRLARRLGTTTESEININSFNSDQKYLDDLTTEVPLLFPPTLPEDLDSVSQRPKKLELTNNAGSVLLLNKALDQLSHKASLAHKVHEETGTINSDLWLDESTCSGTGTASNGDCTPCTPCTPCSPEENKTLPPRKMDQHYSNDTIMIAPNRVITIDALECANSTLSEEQDILLAEAKAVNPLQAPNHQTSHSTEHHQNRARDWMCPDSIDFSQAENMYGGLQCRNGLHESHVISFTSSLPIHSSLMASNPATVHTISAINTLTSETDVTTVCDHQVPQEQIETARSECVDGE